MTTIERIIALASGLGWQVTTQKKKRYFVEFEFQQYTKMGQDFNFCAVMKGNDINSLIENIEDFVEIVIVFMSKSVKVYGKLCCMGR